MIIHYSLSSPEEWYVEIQKILPSRITPNKLILEKSVGEGFLENRELQEGLWVQQLQFRLYEDLQLQRMEAENNDYFNLDFFLFNSILKKEINGTRYELGFENVNLLLTSATCPYNTFVPRQSNFFIFNILFRKEWLFKNVLLDHEHVSSFFDTKAPICISENLDAQLKYLLKSISFTDSKLMILANVLKIIDYLFKRVRTRKLEALNAASLHPEDVSKLLEVKNYLDENANAEITVELLAEKSTMSLSKFKRSFKQVFGQSPYQYHLANKMERAKELLQNASTSVSEVGYLMGYSNLSQFSKAFKNHFGFLPSEVPPIMN